MAGFMAGFGSAFAQSFGQAQSQAHEKEQDKFRMRYQDYISRRDEQIATDKKNASNVKTAKAIVSMTGQPPETWTAAYDLLSSGIDPSAVQKQFSENQAIVTRNTTTPGDTSGPAAGNQDLSASAQSSVDAQMKESGMATPPDGGIFGDLGQRAEAIQPGASRTPQVDRVNNEMSDADQQIAEATGQNLEDVQKTMAPKAEQLPMNKDYEVQWKPKTSRPDASKLNSLGDATGYKAWADLHGTEEEKKVAEATLKTFMNVEAEKTKQVLQSKGEFVTPVRAAIVDSTGKPTGQMAWRRVDSQGKEYFVDVDEKPVDPASLRPYDKSMEDDISKVGGELKPLVTTYNEGVANLNQMARTSQELIALADQNEKSIGISGDVAQIATKYYQGVKGLYEIATGQSADGTIKNYKSELKSVEKAEQEVATLMERTGDASLAATLMDIKATKLAYMMAAEAGQKGKAINQEEFNNFKNAALGGYKKEGIRQNALGAIREAYTNLKDQEALIGQNSAGAGAFESKYGGMPYPDKVIENVDALIGRDQNVRSMVDQAMSSDGKDQTNAKQPNVESTPVPKGAADAGIDQELWDSMLPEEKKLFGGK